VGTALLSKAQILQSIKDLLERESATPKPRQCRHCGSSMRFVESHFLLRGTALTWDVPLPVCPVCDQEIVEDLPRRETIH
jgi:hypothetical protein